MTTKRWAFHVARAGVVLFCLLPSLIAPRSPAGASEVTDRAAAMVRDLAADMWTIRDEHADPDRRKRLLAGAIEGSTNVDLLSRLVLGRHWRSLSTADREAYQTLFSRVVIGGLAQRLDSLLRELDGRLDQHFAITNSVGIGKKDILVRSRVTATDGQSLSVDWRLRRLENKPVVIDLVIEGISLLVSQRAEFAAVIERSRIDGLIEALRSRAGVGDF